MMRKNAIPRLTVVLASAILAPLHAAAADNPAAHQHGHAELQIAMDNTTADVFLRSPAYNLLGFEHQPHSEQQRQQLAELKQWAVSTPLINTEDGNCKVKDASFHSLWPETTSHHEHEHQDEPGNGHSDIEITQSLTCNGLTGEKTLTTSLTERFPALEHLDVQWINASGQGSERLEAGEQQFRIGR